MPAIPEVLGVLVLEKVRTKLTAFGHDPMSSKNPMYFIEFCNAIGKGIAKGTPLLTFTTSDSGSSGIPPLPGAGVGIGIKVNAEYMSQQMYTEARAAVVQKFGKTMHGMWPPDSDNSGRYLKAITDGVAEAVAEHYKICWILASVHPLIYAGSGVVDPVIGTKFSGVIDIAVSSAIQTFGVHMLGSFWPVFCQAIAKGYKQSIETNTTASVTITGVCVPGPSQICAISNTGSGTGVAS